MRRETSEEIESCAGRRIRGEEDLLICATEGVRSSHVDGSVGSVEVGDVDEVVVTEATAVSRTGCAGRAFGET